MFKNMSFSLDRRIHMRAFSLMKYTKNKYRAQTTDENLQSVLRIATSEMEPNMDEILKRERMKGIISHINKTLLLIKVDFFFP